MECDFVDVVIAPDAQSYSSSVNVELYGFESKDLQSLKKCKRPAANQIDFDQIVKINELNEKGLIIVRMMYVYRSVSSAFSSVVDYNPDENTLNYEVDILEPEISKIREMVNFVSVSMDVIFENVSRLILTNGIESPDGYLPPVGLYWVMVQLMDTLFVLDCMKDQRQTLKNDFNRFKQAAQMTKKFSIESYSDVENFLSSKDLRKNRNMTLWTLRERFHQVRQSDRVLSSLLNFSIDKLENKVYITPSERFTLLRTIPHLMVLIDGENTDPRSYNIFTGTGVCMDGHPMKKGGIGVSALGERAIGANAAGTASVTVLQKIVKRYPVLPLHGDLVLTMNGILERAPHFTYKVGGAAAGLSTGSNPVNCMPSSHVAINRERASSVNVGKLRAQASII